jgi:hypothetical protein
MGGFAGLDTRRFCDVVMKGGVTSGVVYPTAICQLATAYILKNIGGTSVGAIAASVTAAAEYRRRLSGTGAGYAELAKLPGFLGGKGNLQALFAADPQARTLLEIALIPIGNASAVTKTLQLLLALFFRYVWIPVLTFAIILGAFSWASSPLTPVAFSRLLFVSALFGIIASLIFVVIWFAYRVIAVLDRNSFGWCHGYSSAASAKLANVADVTTLEANQVPPLFNWLEAFIAQTAGRPASQPLTFGDLWSAPHPPWHTPDTDERSIDFRMVTTCLTLGRPLTLPFDPDNCISQVSDTATDLDDDGKRRPSIYFRAEDLGHFFSTNVVDHMVQFGKQTDLVTDGTYYRFPAADKVPIVVGTRLSMSFPVLFCAIPLYALDATGKMQRIWFSDGGLTSNFPIQFFDNPLTRWPTFAIDLLGGEPSSGTPQAGRSRMRFGQTADLAKYVPGAVFLESAAPPGTVNPWDKIDRGDARGKVLAFASSILDAARSWQDVTLGGLPGNASRIVAIRLTDDQGGLNLNMPPETIQTMTGLGTQAGDTLVNVFAAAGEPDAAGWQRHRWIRYRATMGAISRWLSGFKVGYQPFSEVPAQESYAQLITQLPPDKQPDVVSATQGIASLPIVETFYDVEETPIAVLPTRPVV